MPMLSHASHSLQVLRGSTILAWGMDAARRGRKNRSNFRAARVGIRSGARCERLRRLQFDRFHGCVRDCGDLHLVLRVAGHRCSDCSDMRHDWKNARAADVQFVTGRLLMRVVARWATLSSM